MKYEIKTKQGNNYIVSDDNAWIWISLDRELGLTFTQAQVKMSEGSLDVLTFILHKAASIAGHTELKTQQSWVETEFDEFDVVSDDPKVTPEEVSSAT
jgi:hypothetical protein